MIQVSLKKMVKEVKSHVGYKEKPTNKTVFAKDLDAVKYYTPQTKQGVPWCSLYLDACSYYVIGDVKKTHKWLNQPDKYDLSAGAKYQQKYFKNANQYSKVPRVGAWAFFGDPAKHVGFVIEIRSTTVTTIEGNHNNKVEKVIRMRSEISGYGYPNYINDKEEYTMVQMKNCYRGDECGEVLTIQSLLKCKGFKGEDGKVLALDSKFGKNTEFAVKNYQKKNDLTVDGIVAEKTWTKLLKG